MKTVQELISDADNLNKFMATAPKTQNHLLATIDDEYTQDVYLTLLMSVAEMAGQFDETKDNPIAYVCRIAAALPIAPDMQEIFRRSLIIDEKFLSDYSVTLKQRDLQNLLLFDALTMQILYAKNSAPLSEYIAGLANVFGTGKDGLAEILLIVKAVINQQADFDYKFQHVNCFEFLPYLRGSCKNLFVEAADVFFMDFETERDITNDLQPLTLENKKLVHLCNAYLHDKKFSFYIKATETAEFENCRFENLSDEQIREFEVHGNQYSFPDEIRLMTFEQVGTVKIIGCKFAGMINNLIDYRESYTILAYSQYVDRGILIFIGDINQFTVRDCEFKDCFFRELMPKTTFAPFGGWTSGLLIRDKFTPNNFTLADYLKCASVNFERDTLISGYNVRSDDVKNNSVINSFAF